MLKALESDLANKTFTADALLTQTKLADFLIGRGAHFLFAVKGNRPNLLADLAVHFQKRRQPVALQPALPPQPRHPSSPVTTSPARATRCGPSPIVSAPPGVTVHDYGNEVFAANPEAFKDLNVDILLPNKVLLLPVGAGR